MLRVAHFRENICTPNFKLLAPMFRRSRIPIWKWVEVTYTKATAKIVCPPQGIVVLQLPVFPHSHPQLCRAINKLSLF